MTSSTDLLHFSLRLRSATIFREGKGRARNFVEEFEMPMKWQVCLTLRQSPHYIPEGTGRVGNLLAEFRMPI